MEELVTIVSQVGFPIAVSIYLLLERSRSIKENTGAIHELREAIVELRASLKA